MDDKAVREEVVTDLRKLGKEDGWVCASVAADLIAVQADRMAELRAEVAAVRDILDPARTHLTATQAATDVVEALATVREAHMGMTRNWREQWERAEAAERALAQALAERDGVRVDAERYRHVRANPAMLLHLSNRDFDAAIDAARGAQGRGE